MRDRLEQVGLFAVNAHSTLPDLAQLAAPTGSISESRAARGMVGAHGDDPRLDRIGIRRVAGMEMFDILGVVALKEGSSILESRAAWGMAGTHGDDPRLDLPEPGPDEPFRSEEASRSPTVPHSGDVSGALPTKRAALSVGLSAVPRSGGDTGPTGLEHFLQGGYFAHRENAVGLSEKLANAGLDVLMEQTTNRAGKTRWLVLVGPYRQKEDALRARSAAPKLLAEAFHTMHDN